MNLDTCAHRSNIETSQIITIIIISSGILITTIILLNAFKEFPKHHKMENIFKCLFYSSLATSTLTQISVLTALILCVQGNQKPTLILLSTYTASYLLCLLLILTTLLLRLHYTFKESIYKITKKTRNALLILYIFTIIFCTSSVCLYMTATITLQSWDQNDIKNKVWTTSQSKLMPIVIYLAVIGGILYVITAIWANMIFTKNLVQLTHSRADSMFKIAIRSIKNIHEYKRVQSKQEIDAEVNGMELNDDQMRLIDSISRYVSLFTIAIITSMINVLLVMSGEWVNWYNGHLQILAMFSCLDCTVNIVCLYLQYQFNIKYYNKWCKCIERCWRKYFIKKAKKICIICIGKVLMRRE